MAVRTVEIIFSGNVRQLESALERAGLTADVTAKGIGEKFAAGTARAGGGLSKLGALGATFGIPMIGHLDAMGRKMDETHARTTRFSAAVAEAGGTILKAGTIGFAGAGLEATKLASTFQDATAQIAGHAGISAEAAKKIGDAFLSTGGKSIFSATQMAQAFSTVAGQLKITEGHALSASEALRVMTSAGDLAEASHVSLNTATQSLSQTMQAYHLSVGQASSASDTLFNVSRALNVPVDNVAQALAKMHARLGELAPSLKDTSALMVAFGQQGLTGTRGILMVSTALNSMLAPSKSAKSVLDQLHVSLTNSRGEFVGMGGVISQLQPKFAQMTAAQQRQVAQLIFGKGAWQAMLQVVQAGTGAFNQTAQAATRAGSAHQAAAQQAKTFHDTMLRLKAAVEDLAVRFGNFLIPKIQAVSSAISSAISWLEKHKAAAQALGAVITGVLGVAVAAFAYQKAVAFIGATKEMIAGIARMGAAAVTGAGRVIGLGAASATAAPEIAAEGDAAAVASGQMSLFGNASVAAEGKVAGAGAAAATAGGEVAGAGGAASIAAPEVATLGTAFSAMLGPLAAITAGFFLFHQQIAQVYQDLQNLVSAIPGVGGALGSITSNVLDPLGIISGNGPGGVFGGQGVSLGTSNIPSSLVAPATSIGNSIGGMIGALGGTGGAVSGLGSSGIGFGSAGSGIPGLSIPTAGGGGGSKTTTKRTPSLHLPQFTISGTASWFNHGPGEAGPGPADPNNFHQASGLPFSDPGIAVYNKNTLGGYYAVKDPRTGQVYVVRQSDIGPAPGTGRVVDFNWQAMQTLLGGHDPTNQQFSLGYLGKSLPAGFAPYLNKAIPPSALGMGSTTTTTSVAQAVKTLQYANPFAGASNLNRGQIDMGQDFSMSPGSRIGAIGAGQVVGMMGGWYPHDGNPNGGNYIAYKLTQGPNAGKVVYVAEQINPTVHQGQAIAAGQTIGTYASAGSGIEMGFANPNNPLQTLSQAQGTSANRHGPGGTPEGQAFTAFLRQIGGGIYTTTGGGTTTSTTQTGPSAAQLLADAIKKYNEALKKAGSSILKSMTDLTDYDKGISKKLEEILGVSLSTRDRTKYTTPHGANLVTTTGQAYQVTGMGTSGLHFTRRGNASHPTYASELTAVDRRLEGLGPDASTYLGGINPNRGNLTTTTGQVYKVSGMGTSGLHFGFQGNAGTKLGLTDQYGIPTEGGFTKQAVPILQRAEKSGQLDDLIAQLKASHDKALQQLARDLVAEHKKALVTLAQELYAEQVTKDAELLDKQTAHLKDVTTAQQHLDQALLDVSKAQSTKQHDAATAVVTQMDDQTAIVRDSYATMVQAVQDATQVMADTSEGIVAGIQDQTAIRVDILGERGLYGLALIAQKLQVTHDQDKAYWDQQINLSKLNLDQVTAQAHSATSAAQAALNQTTLQEDQLVAAAQQTADTVSVVQTLKVASAQQQADTFMMTGDTNQMLAQIGVDLSANLPKGAQDAAGATLKYWTSFNALGQQMEAANLQNVTDAANKSISDASTKYQGVQDAASAAIAAANRHLADVTGQANGAIAQAQSSLQGVTDAANQTLAQDQASIDVMRETASTQYAGSGLVVNIYGLNPTDGQAVASEVGWAMRSHVPA